MRKCFTLILLVCCSAVLKAQVKGVIIDSSSNKPVDRVAIGMVVKSNPTDTSYVLTNEKGEFSFGVVPASSFSIVFINNNYKAFAKYIPVTKAEKTIDLGKIVAKEEVKTLAEIIVQAAPIVIKEDTIEYNAASFKVKENAVVEDLLKKLPGIEVDKSGNIKAQGKSVTKVKVNGKDFFGGDVQTATKELPANLVDKIQVIDDYGDQATVSGIKDGEPDKTINIQLKKDKNRGFFGRATVGAGTEERYQGSFNGNYFNNNSQVSVFANSNNTGQSLFNFGSGGNRGMTSMIRTSSSAMSDMGGMSGAMNAMQSGDQGFLGAGSSSNSGIASINSIGTNYRDQWSKRVSVYGSYSFTHRNTSKEQNTNSQNFFTNSSFNKVQDDNSITKSDNHRFTFNLEWQADSFNYFKFSPAISYSTNDANALTNFTNIDGTSKALTSNGYNKNINGSETPNFSGSFLYNHKYRKRGRNFSASGNIGNSGSESNQVVRSLTNLYSPLNTIFQNQNIIQDNNNHNYGVRVTYSEPINKYRSIDFSASHNLSYARNNKATYFVDTLTNVKSFMQNLSNDYENNYYNDRYGISLRTTKKKYNYTIGISALPVNLKGKSLTKDSAYKPIQRVNIFPIARFAYNFSRSKTFNFNYQGSATQPSFSQLQDVLDISNQQSFTRGNPNLKPAINHNLNLSFNNFNFVSGKVLFTNFMFSTIKNQIVNNTIRRGNNGLQTTMPENVNGYYNVNGFYTYSKPYKNRKYVISLNGTANYNHNINLIDSIKTTGNNWLLSQGFNFEFNYKEWLQFGTGVSYSLNDIKYNNKTGVSSLQNSSSNAWTISSNINMDLPGSWVLKYDFDYTINNGISSSISQNPAIMNASIEKQIFKKKNGVIRLSAYDLFNEQTNINRSVSANSIIDTRSNRLTRYFMGTFTYRLQKFAGTGSATTTARPVSSGAVRMF